MVSLCYSASSNGGTPVLDPAKVNGKIVTCTRGTNARVDKSLAVMQAGGVGMVEIDNGAGLVAEVHSVPTVHVTAANGALIKAYAASQNSSASMTQFVTGTSSLPAPVLASFSSRGPNLYDGNQLKPDLAAPGVDIIAAVTPELSASQRADIVRGPDQRLGFLPGHLDGRTARCRYRRPAEAAASDLDPGDDQVGPDDERHRHLPGRPGGRSARQPAVRPGRRPHQPEWRERSGPGLQRHAGRLPEIHVRPGRGHQLHRRLDRRLQPEPAVHRGQQCAGHGHHHPRGHQRATRPRSARLRWRWHRTRPSRSR
jgi:hypothetical protein